MFGFEKLNVWQESIDFTVYIYSLTERFPKTELYSLTDQLRRASSSISANIAEGSSRQSKKEQAHFTTIAFSSLMETLNHLIFSFRLNYINKQELEELKKQIDSIAHKLLYENINNLKPKQSFAQQSKTLNQKQKLIWNQLKTYNQVPFGRIFTN